VPLRFDLDFVAGFEDLRTGEGVKEGSEGCGSDCACSGKREWMNVRWPEVVV